MNANLLVQHQALLIGRWITDLANTSAFIFLNMPNLNWAGFYLFENNRLVLGPFQGKPACTEIALGRGVCGKAAQKREVIVVPDVHQFEDHIVCDTASQSEIVVPLVFKNKLLGVLDADAPVKNRFSAQDKEFLMAIAQQLIQKNAPMLM